MKTHFSFSNPPFSLIFNLKISKFEEKCASHKNVIHFESEAQKNVVFQIKTRKSMTKNKLCIKFNRMKPVVSD